MRGGVLRGRESESGLGWLRSLQLHIVVGEETKEDYGLKVVQSCCQWYGGVVDWGWCYHSLARQGKPKLRYLDFWGKTELWGRSMLLWLCGDDEEEGGGSALRFSSIRLK